jgi:hypothetical protein
MSRGLVVPPVQDMGSSFHPLVLTFKREKGLCNDSFIGKGPNVKVQADEHGLLPFTSATNDEPRRTEKGHCIL